MLALAACYPLLAHLAVAAGSPALTVASLAALAAAVLLRSLARASVAAWLAAAAIAALLALAERQSWVWLPLYAPSVAGDAAAAWVFGRTLVPGRTSLIERFICLLHAPGEARDPRITAYARRLTGAWTALLAALGLASLALALCAVPHGILLEVGVAPPFSVAQDTWSLFANVAEYVIVIGFFAGEYAYRRRRFPEQPSAGLVDFLRRLIAVTPRLFARPAPRGNADRLGGRA